MNYEKPSCIDTLPKKKNNNKNNNNKKEDKKQNVLIFRTCKGKDVHTKIDLFWIPKLYKPLLYT
jgi:hypothetical protein